MKRTCFDHHKIPCLYTSCERRFLASFYFWYLKWCRLKPIHPQISYLLVESKYNLPGLEAYNMFDRIKIRRWVLVYTALTSLALASCKVTLSDRHNGKSAYANLSKEGDASLLEKRHLEFEGTVNFRDLGGVKTTEGRTVKLGKIYRSDHLAGLETREFDKFNALQIGTVYDLRTNHEIKNKEDHLPQHVKYLHTPTVEDNEGEIVKLRDKVINGEISEKQAVEETVRFYEDAVTVHAGSLKTIIQDITASEEPVLYHCSAGKDRTGIVSALILSILRVDRQTIVNEYMLSNYYRKDKAEKTLGKAKLGKIIKRKMDLKAVEVFTTVDESFINATFNAIDKTYGGIEPFIQNQLGIDPATRQRLIDKLTY
jgi:protein-tyrosine phosphatase